MTTENKVDGRTLRFQHRRPELLAAVTQYVLDHGGLGVSLRPVAAALGVSHATLIRHFGTKEKLLREVLSTIRADFQSQLLNDPDFVAATSEVELLRAVWRKLCEPLEQRQYFVLFSSVAGAQTDSTRAMLANELVTEWLELIDRVSRRHRDNYDSSTIATFLLAQIRGLQLDLITIGDTERVERAFELTVSVLAREIELYDRSVADGSD